MRPRGVVNARSYGLHGTSNLPAWTDDASRHRSDDDKTPAFDQDACKNASPKALSIRHAFSRVDLALSMVTKQSNDQVDGGSFCPLQTSSSLDPTGVFKLLQNNQPSVNGTV